MNLIQKLRTFLKYLFYSCVYRNKLVEEYSNVEMKFHEVIHDIERKNEDFVKKIWMYWEGDYVPFIVQKCVKRVKTLHPDFQVYFLNDESVFDFLPDLKLNNFEIPKANKSDLIRLELLYRYGGIWLDAAVILNESLHWTIPIMKKNIYDCVGFSKVSNNIDSSYPVIESWFLCTSPHNLFIKRWLYELRPIGELGAKQYFEIISQRNDYEIIKQNIEEPSYLLGYLSQQIAMRSFKDFNFYYQIAEDTAFYYQEKLHWNFKLINFEFMLKKAPFYLPPITKLIRHNYSDIDYCKVNGFVNHQSIIGNILN